MPMEKIVKVAEFVLMVETFLHMFYNTQEICHIKTMTYNFHEITMGNTSKTDLITYRIHSPSCLPKFTQVISKSMF